MYGDVKAMLDRYGREEITRLSQLEDRATDEICQPKVERALKDASALIDGYLRGRYALPVKKVPDDLIRAATIIARYDLAKSGVSEPTEQMEKDYQAVLKWLSDIQKGMVVLDCPQLTVNGGYGGQARFSDREAVFNPNSLRGA